MTPDRLTDERLEEMERLCAEATPGPWRVRHLCSGCGPDEDEGAGLGLEIEGPPQPWHEGQFSRAADAQFIAAARDALPALIAEVRALRRAESVINIAREMACEVRSGGPPAPATIRALAQAVEDLDGGELRCPPDELAQCRATVKALIGRERALREENAALRRVAEAAERDVADARAACGHFADVPHCHSAPYDRTCSDCPYDVVYRTDIALAEWRRVRGGEAG